MALAVEFARVRSVANICNMRPAACVLLRLAPRWVKFESFRTKGQPTFRSCSHESAPEANQLTDRSPIPVLKTRVFEALKGYPPSSDHLYDSVLRTLISHGFEDKQVVQVVTKAERIVELHKSLNSILSFWRTMFRSEPVYLQTISEYPELLYMMPEAIEERKRELFTVFPNKDIVRLIEICPQAFIDDWDTVMEKVVYIVHAMVIGSEHIVNSGALAYGLLHIKTRHKFLLCCGKYRTPKPKEVKTNNPPLHNIVGLPLRLYLNMCGLTAQEYFVFEKIVAREHERESMEDSDDDDDYDLD